MDGKNFFENSEKFFRSRREAEPAEKTEKKKTDFPEKSVCFQMVGHRGLEPRTP